MRRTVMAALAATLILSGTARAAEPAPRIAWFGTLKSGLAEAKASNRPILFVSAAPHCLGVPGEW